MFCSFYCKLEKYYALSEQTQIFIVGFPSYCEIIGVFSKVRQSYSQLRNNSFKKKIHISREWKCFHWFIKFLESNNRWSKNNVLFSWRLRASLLHARALAHTVVRKITGIWHQQGKALVTDRRVIPANSMRLTHHRMIVCISPPFCSVQFAACCMDTLISV